MAHTIDNWRASFPNGHTPRQLQVQAIDFALDTFLNKNKKYCILQLPTGVGKSHIAVTVAQYLHTVKSSWKTYILSTMLFLQDQYKKQFPSCVNISARGNYLCTQYPGSTCAEMRWIHKYTTIQPCQSCVFQNLKHRFANNHCSITNTAFFMSNIQYNQEFITKRKLLVIDQCHTLQEQIIKYKGLQLQYNLLHTQYGYRQSDWISQKQDIMTWVSTKFKVWLQDKKRSFESTLSNSSLNFNKSKVVDISKKYDFLDKLLCQLNRMLSTYSPMRWVLQSNIDNKVVKFTPLYAYDYSEQVMFSRGEHVLFMSGTILNKDSYCKALGIPKSQCQFLSVDSPFPIQNRPIFILNSGSMSKKNLLSSIDDVVLDINKILKLHSGQKGIIHVSSHKLASLIVQRVKSKRLIIVQDFNNRNEMLSHHFDSTSDTVLISPSLMQGLDLKDQLSRFQIIAKVPYPNLGDKYISIKKQRVTNWYAYQTAKVLVQSYGRSIRSENDYAVTYILDTDVNNMFKYHWNLFPKYFKEAISYGRI